MVTDRELLELAAKAIGFDLHVNSVGDYQLWKDGEYVGFWIPLEDDGDALRLAVKLGADIQPKGSGVEVWVFESRASSGVVEYGDDPYAATRRAIVRAAAEVGKLGEQQ